MTPPAPDLLATLRQHFHFDAFRPGQEAAIRRVLASGTIVESHKAAILAALAITDELFQSRRQQEDLAQRLKQLSGDLARLLPPQKRQSVGG